MKKLNCLVVDDEPVARKIIKEFIVKTDCLVLAAEAESATRAAALLKIQEVDLIFLDIEMPRVSGLEWLRLSALPPMVIITTAFREYALDGYELDVIDYLLKPISYERFSQASQKAFQYHTLTHFPGQASKDWIFVRTDKKIERLSWKEILYFESMGNYVKIHTNKATLISYLTLKTLAEQVPAGDFVRVHQSFVVNLSAVGSIEGNQIHIGSARVPLSRNHRDAFMEIINNHLLKR